MTSDYAKFHTDRLNLAIHLVFVPLCSVAFVLSIISLVKVQLVASGLFLVAAFLAFAVQAVGHKREAVPPERFTSPGNFAQRIFLEQYFKFWRFLFRGEFARAWSPKV